MAYVLPQISVFQEFSIAPTSVDSPRNAHITGGHAQLFRYSNSDEKTVINLGEYDETQDTPYSWPERPAGAQVDFGYVKLYAEDALLEYYSNTVGSGALVAPVVGYKNRVRDAETSFKTNGAYLRSGDLFDRDAKVGDYVFVRGIHSAVEYTLETSIRGFQGDLVAAAIDGNEVHDPANATAQSLSVATTFLTPSLQNSVEPDADASAYDGLETGHIDETYTVEVISSSVGGDLTTARLRVTSASGTDNQSNVIPSAAGDPTDIGTRGFVVTFDSNGTASTSSIAASEGISSEDMVEGQKWRFVVEQAFVVPQPSATGTYTGTADTTYVIEVTKGGVWAASPEITVSTTTGYDYSGPTAIMAAATTYPVGNHGVLVQFCHTAICKGDKYYVNVTSAKQGAMRTLILADDLPDNLRLAADLDLKLCIRKNIEISRELLADAPSLAYDTSDTEFTVNSGILLQDDSWTYNGVKLPLPLKGGTLFVEYRAWLHDYVNALDSLNDTADLPAMLGQASPDNPLYWGVYLALQNSNGQPVYFSSVADPSDVDSWLSVLEVLDGNTDVYNLVPLTTNLTVLGAWKGHVLSESSPEVGNFRGAVFGIDVPSVKSVVSAANSSDSSVVLARLADDSDTSGTQYTILSVPANNAKFVTKGVRAKDKVRFLYNTDGFGNETYSEFIVDEVLSEGSLRLVTGNSSAITTAQKAEVWRTLNKTDLAIETQAQVSQHKNRRVVVIANSTVGLAGAVFPGYFAGAAVAGLRSGSLPHQGLTNVSLSGIDDVGSMVTSMNGTQLNLIAEAGGWIIKKDITGVVYNRHAVTSDPTDLNSREEVVRTNVDDISFNYSALYKPYIGKANITDALLNVFIRLFDSTTTRLKNTITPLAGPQLVTGNISNIRQHAIYKDKIVIEATIEVPYPLNNIDLKLVV